MSQKRHDLEGAEEAIVLRSLGLRLPSGFHVETHTHPWHQLVYATEGVMTVETATGNWVVPPHRAVWIPAGLQHGVRTTGQVRMRTLYFRSDLVERLPGSCCVINVMPLLRELILEAVRCGMLSDTVPHQLRLVGVLLDQIARTKEGPLEIKIPLDVRARRVAERARNDLSEAGSLTDYAEGCGASVRTIERLFVQETGLTFSRWLQRVKALHALERLAAGDSVTAAGFSVGYDSTSAFIAMFKRVLGRTPGSYFSVSAEDD